jgi:hypothetical protein
MPTSIDENGMEIIFLKTLIVLLSIFGLVMVRNAWKELKDLKNNKIGE